jgi:hypothetical protein
MYAYLAYVCGSARVSALCERVAGYISSIWGTYLAYVV